MSAVNSFINCDVTEMLVAFHDKSTYQRNVLDKYLSLSLPFIFVQLFWFDSSKQWVSVFVHFGVGIRRKKLFLVCFQKSKSSSSTKTWNCCAGNAAKETTTTTILTRRISSQCHLSWKPLMGNKMKIVHESRRFGSFQLCHRIIHNANQNVFFLKTNAITTINLVSLTFFVPTNNAIVVCSKNRNDDARCADWEERISHFLN